MFKFIVETTIKAVIFQRLNKFKSTGWFWGTSQFVVNILKHIEGKLWIPNKYFFVDWVII